MYCTYTLLDLEKPETKDMTELSISFVERTLSGKNSPAKGQAGMEGSY